MEVIWSRLASTPLRAAYDYIKQSSFQNAEKVRDEIIDRSIAAAQNAEVYPLDKHKS
jgi:plasmid stabilization system protein ParE